MIKFLFTIFALTITTSAIAQQSYQTAQQRTCTTTCSGYGSTRTCTTTCY